MLLEIYQEGGPSAAESYVMKKLEQKSRIMGFGHRVYAKKPDPRAVFLRNYISTVAERTPDGADLAVIYDIVAEVLNREKGLHANTDYPIGLLLYLLRDLRWPQFWSFFYLALFEY